MPKVKQPHKSGVIEFWYKGNFIEMHKYSSVQYRKEIISNFEKIRTSFLKTIQYTIIIKPNA